MCLNKGVILEVGSLRDSHPPVPGGLLSQQLVVVTPTVIVIIGPLSVGCQHSVRSYCISACSDHFYQQNECSPVPCQLLPQCNSQLLVQGLLSVTTEIRVGIKE